MASELWKIGEANPQHREERHMSDMEQEGQGGATDGTDDEQGGGMGGGSEGGSEGGGMGDDSEGESGGGM